MDRRTFINSTTLVGGALLTTPSIFANISIKTELVVIPDWKGKKTTFNHSWEGLGNIDQMRWIMRGDTQKQLDLFRDELRLKHVRAVGIFDNDLYVYDSDPTNFNKKVI